MMLAVTTWADVVIALIAIVPGVVAAYLAYKIRIQIRTPSGKPIGEVAEFTHDTAIANNLMLLQNQQPTQEK